MPPTSTKLSAVLQIGISMWDFRNHSFWAWLLIGLLAGWLAGLIFRGRGYGCVTDIILGLIGSVMGGWLFNYFGIMNGDFFYSLAAATAGAMILVGISRLFSPVPKK
jgi:uncharacterized membrane protein YeaQ/YmgE (transglycosylase-associated protein family)